MEQRELINCDLKLIKPLRTNSRFPLELGKTYQLIQANWDEVDVYTPKVYCGRVHYTDVESCFSQRTHRKNENITIITRA